MGPLPMPPVVLKYTSALKYTSGELSFPGVSLPVKTEVASTCRSSQKSPFMEKYSVYAVGH